MNPTYNDIVAAATSRCTKVTEWADGGSLTEVEYELTVRQSPTDEPARLVWVIDGNRFVGMKEGQRLAVCKMVHMNDDPGAAVYGRKIRLNGTVENTQHFLGHVDVV